MNPTKAHILSFSLLVPLVVFDKIENPRIFYNLRLGKLTFKII